MEEQPESQIGMLVTKEALKDLINMYGEEGAANELASGFRTVVLKAIEEMNDE